MAFFVFLILVHALIGIIWITQNEGKKVCRKPRFYIYHRCLPLLHLQGLELDPDTPETLDNNQVQQKQFLVELKIVVVNKYY